VGCLAHKGPEALARGVGNAAQADRSDTVWDAQLEPT